MIDLCKYDNFLKQALDKWGLQSQMLMGIEESSELIHEISKWFRGREHNIEEELADVLLVCRQFMIIFGEEKIIEYMEEKIERLEERLKQ